MASSASISPRKTGRPADRQNQIVREVREQIVKGHLAPGSRLPTREQIGRTYGAGTHTVQRALDRLKSDGFIETSERGTSVSLRPPHLTRYALVFPDIVQGPTWGQFWTALNEEGQRLRGGQSNNLSLYYDVSSDPHTPDYQALLAEVKGHSIAGIIFVTFPHRLVGTPILEEPGIPRVGIMAPTRRKTFPAVNVDHHGFYTRAIEYLAARGRRKVAFLNPPGVHPTTEILGAMVRSAGMETLNFWNIIVSVGHPESTEGLMQLLLHAPRDMWPDALIIGDDNFVPFATAGLVAAGARIPEDILVLAHSNFPWTPASAVPVTRLGFDAREILAAAVTCISNLRRGQAAPDHTLIPPRFEAELLPDPLQALMKIQRAGSELVI